MAELLPTDHQLRPCPFCGDPVRFHGKVGDENCTGCHHIECTGCGAMVDLSVHADPENDCETLEALRAAIVPYWNERAADDVGADRG